MSWERHPERRSGPDRWRLARLAVREVGRALRAGTVRAWRGLAPLGRRSPRHIVIAPQDLRTSDVTVATDIYGGYFAFAGKAAATGGRSPFDIEPPSLAWSEALHGLGWLRHLRAADTALARANARALVDEFLKAGRSRRPAARRTPVLARRVTAFLSHSPLLLDGADHAFYQRFLKALGRSVYDLETDLKAGVLPLPRLQAVVALSQAALCCEGFESRLHPLTRRLAQELDAQILPDGGHVSRNPQVMIELLLDLLPLRQAYANRGFDPPDALVRAIDRMLPMLRLFRHGDGTLAHVNGVGRTPADQMATLLAYEAARRQPMRHAPHTGYERLEAKDTIVVADVGAAPPVDHSGEAHAGCLSFELSRGRERIVVNCGTPGGGGDLRLATRSTAAHSTATIADASSVHFLTDGGGALERLLSRWLRGRLGDAILRGPDRVLTERQDRGEALSLSAMHDGYLAVFGLLHERRWRLTAEGDRLEGEDVFTRAAGAPAPPVEATIRFHLMPGVRASRMQDGRTVMLLLGSRDAWRFEVDGAEPRVEESAFFAAPDPMRRTEQIVIALDPRERPNVRWSFERVAKPVRTAEDATHQPALI